MTSLLSSSLVLQAGTPGMWGYVNMLSHSTEKLAAGLCQGQVPWVTVDGDQTLSPSL